MRHLADFEDDQFKFEEYTHIRDVARAFVMDDEGRIAIHLIKRNDAFGECEYIETPGGGVDEGETFEEAIVRECDEELGLQVEVVECIGEVCDAYNLLKRRNRNVYFLCKAIKKTERHFVSEGDSLIQGTVWMWPSQLLLTYETQIDLEVPLLVKRRELAALRQLLEDHPDLLTLGKHSDL